MYQSYKDGWLEVICGCMFAGKTEELIRRVKVFEFSKKEVLVFKPKIDNRYSENKVVSHAGSQTDSIVVDSAKEILDYIKESTAVVAIDEVQFFDADIVEVCQKLAGKGIRVMVAGLDTDFRGEPFGSMPILLSQAEFVTKLTAVCNSCGGPATRTQRIIDGQPAAYDGATILVGAAESYEARCRHCHQVPGAPLKLKELKNGCSNC